MTCGHIYQTNYDKKSIHSANIYQIFTYVKNKDVAGAGKVSGILLYAKTDDEDIDNDFIIDGNKISVKTLDLNADFIKVEGKLNELVSEF